MHGALLIQQQGAVPCHADQYIARTFILHHLCRRCDLPVGGQLYTGDLAQLMVVRLDEERTVAQHIHEQVAGGIHDRADAAALEPGQNPLIGGLRQTCGDAACQHQNIVLLQTVELFLQRPHCILGDVGTSAVQLGLLPRLDLDIDACHSLCKADEISFQPLRSKAALQPGAGLTRHKAERHALTAKLCQHTGHIDALAAQHAVLTAGAVHIADPQLSVKPHNIVDRRVEGYGVDHRSVSFTSVSRPYFGSGQRLVRIAASPSALITAG